MSGMKDVVQDNINIEFSLVQTVALLDHLGTYLSKAVPKAKTLAESLPDEIDKASLSVSDQKAMISLMKIEELIKCYNLLEKNSITSIDKFKDSNDPALREETIKISKELHEKYD